MSELFKILTASHMRLKPGAPPSSQVIACPAGYTGSGQTQTRTVTWDVASQSWVTGGWNTVAVDCQIDQFTFVGPDLGTGPGGWEYSTETVEGTKYQVLTYDQTLSANGHTARIVAKYHWYNRAISYEVFAPTLAGRLCRPHWKDEPPSYKGPESTWQAFAPLDGSGYLSVPRRAEPEYGFGPPKNIKGGEVNGCNIDIR